jgi:diguanylate cyclase (GGDEF)-like protein
MPDIANPNRSPTFRLITIASSGLGSFVIGMWGLHVGFGDSIAGMATHTLGSIITGLCALAAGLASLSFFGGVDESAAYVHRETHFDKLTGLHARVSMVGQIAGAAARTLKSGEPYFLIDIDIDRFKHVNDSIGYSQGDELIRSFAERLRAALPREATIGRIGAGEFAVLLPDGAGDIALEELLDRLVAALAEPYQLSRHLQSVNVSVGVVAMPKDGTDPVLLLRRSNLALQHARAAGIDNWAVFQPEFGKVADHRQWIESELHSAFMRGDFDLHYQPQLDLTQGKVVGYEALIRWRHPERGMIAPMEFISIAEQTGMIVPIGEWVLRRACNDAVRYLPGDCFVAINISPVQFMAKDFIALVEDVIRTTGIKPERLELEVTETAMMQDKERAAAILKQLTEKGISVAVDDFGTGYSNLSYLIDFSFHKLKIDRSFVSRIDTDTSTGAVVSTIVGLSRALGVDTIAEGVETESQATMLRAAGCRVFQGYLFGKPAPLMIDNGVVVPASREAPRVAATLH